MEVINGLLTALNTYGPTVAIVAALFVCNALFVWREWKREDSNTKQIKELQDQFSAQGKAWQAKFEETVMPIVAKYETLASGCKEAIERSTRVFEQLIGK